MNRAKQPRNARFWTWINGGWTKITLAPGASLCHDVAYATEEGGRAEFRVWDHEGDCVYSSYSWRERDCDGLGSGGFDARADLARLAAIPGHDPSDPARPDWTDCAEWRRDHAAEAAGY